MSGLGTSLLSTLASNICPASFINYTFPNQNITRLVNETLQPAIGWNDLSQRLALLLNVDYWSLQNISIPLFHDPFDLLLSCDGTNAIIQTVPQVCNIIYGNQFPDGIGLGVFVGYITQIWLNVAIFAALPLLKHLYLKEKPESHVGKSLLQGYYTLLSLTLTTNLIYAAWNSAASIHELTRRPALSTHWYLHDSNIVLFCMASLTSLISAFLLYSWEEYVSSMLVNITLWIVVLGLFSAMMVIDNWLPEERMQSIAAACLNKHREMEIPGMDLSGLSDKLWHSTSGFDNVLGQVPLVFTVLLVSCILLMGLGVLVTTPLKCINNTSIVAHLTRLVRCIFRLPASKPVKPILQGNTSSRDPDLEAQTADLNTATKKLKLKLLGLIVSILIFLVWATTSTILLYKTRAQILQAIASHGDPWLFGQYGAVILWIAIVFEVVRIAIATIVAFAFDKQESTTIRDNEELHELGSTEPADTSSVHSTSGSQNGQESSTPSNAIGTTL